MGGGRAVRPGRHLSGGLQGPLGATFSTSCDRFFKCRSGSVWVGGAAFSEIFKFRPGRRPTCARHWVGGEDNNARESRAVRTGAGHFAAGPFRRRNTPTTLKADAPNFDQKGELLVYVSRGGGIGYG